MSNVGECTIIFKVDWDDAEEEDGIDPWVNLKDVKALRAAFVG